MSKQPALVIENVTKNFGGVCAVDHVSAFVGYGQKAR